ncbi:MAG: chemotaxis response regulator protein-glutamate methylesterase [Marivirga sp.]|nr:chemotaxis response regulator protein-glutamate methylesterase [Marivirga sp.]
MSVIKVLIVDDSALIRQTFKTLLESDPEIQVIGTASDPFIAVHKIQREKPDVITLDIEMPRMDGLTFLKKIMMQAPMPVIVISNQTSVGADVALKALEIGAVDVMTKPGLSNEIEIDESRIRLIDKVRSAFFSKRGSGTRTDGPPSVAGDSSRVITKGVPIQQGTFSGQSVIAIGASTGGTEAIKSFLEVLPPKMPPILIVQHMPEKFTSSFAKRLNDLCVLEVKEAEDHEAVSANTVYIAPGNHHMAIRNHNGKPVIRIYQGDLVNRHRPSVNVLFHSVAEVKGKHAIGIIMTGMGDDGATGMLAMHQKGAFTVAQDEATSVVFGMPLKAILAGGVSSVLPLADIPKEVCGRI